MTSDGFVYLWYDRDSKMFYLGSHKGREDDGYVCSSKHMLKEYKARSESFKRRILERCDEMDILKAEQKWLDLIKSNELYYKKGVYYNVKKNAAGGDTTKYHKNRDEIIRKRYGKKHSESIKAAIKKRTPEATLLHQQRRSKSLRTTYLNGFTFYQSKPITVFCNGIIFNTYSSILEAAREIQCDYSTFLKRVNLGIWIVKQKRKHPFNVGDIINFIN